jgi:hypothetical protein
MDLVGNHICPEEKCSACSDRNYSTKQKEMASERNATESGSQQEMVEL